MTQTCDGETDRGKGPSSAQPNLGGDATQAAKKPSIKVVNEIGHKRQTLNSLQDMICLQSIKIQDIFV